MGKKSIKENKNIYQLTREELGLTREKASELLETVSPERIEKIENEKATAHPDEILKMSDCYKVPLLCNYYCSHECPIGQVYVPEIQINNLSEIILKMLSSLNSIEKDKNRLIEITADGEITEDEYNDFYKIQNTLEKISITVEALQLWLEKEIDSDKIDKTKFEKLCNDQK